MIIAEMVAPERIRTLIGRIRGQRPLVHHITNPATAGAIIARRALVAAA